MMKKKTNPAKNASREGKGFFGLLSSRVLHFKEAGKNKTASNYLCALKHFKRFRKEEDLVLADLTVHQMKDFQTYLIGQGLKMNTVSLYNRMLKAAYNYALDEEILQTDRRPFRKVFTGREQTRKRTLEKKELKRLMQLDLGKNEKQEFSRDMFLFSIYMQGMAFVDIARLTKAQVRAGYIIYQRSKTNRYLKIAIQPCAQEIIDKWMVDDSPYLFPILYDRYKKRPVRYNTALRMHNKQLHGLAALLGLKEPLSSYVARHTWASFAKWAGVKDTVISEAMGHNNMATTAIYLALLNTEVIASANKKVLSVLMKWRN